MMTFVRFLNLLNTFPNIFDNSLLLAPFQHHYHCAGYFSFIVIAHGAIPGGIPNGNIRNTLMNNGFPLSVALMDMFSISF